MPINSKKKGAQGEREFAKFLNDTFDLKARRGVQYCGHPDAPDVAWDSRIHIECKRVEKLNLENAIQQAQKDASEAQVPIVAHRKNRHEWKITLNAKDIVRFSRIICELAPDEGL